MKDKFMNSRFVRKLKAQAEENPTATIMVMSGAATALSYLMKANTERSNSKTWRKEVERRETKDRIIRHKHR